MHEQEQAWILAVDQSCWAAFRLSHCLLDHSFTDRVTASAQDSILQPSSQSSTQDSQPSTQSSHRSPQQPVHAAMPQSELLALAEYLITACRTIISGLDVALNSMLTYQRSKTGDTWGDTNRKNTALLVRVLSALYCS